MQEMATTLGRSFTASARFKAAFKYLAKESVAKAAAYYPRLQIKDGKWGIGNKQEDVTDLLKSKILGDRLFYEASREFLGTDPAFGVGKYLTIHFTFDGEERKIRIPEGDRNILPHDLPP
jgi:hypothetical protein